MTYTEPLITLVLVLLIAGLARAWRRSKSRARWLLLAGTASLFLISWRPVEWVAAQSLEGWYRRQAPAGDADAIVVLSGDVESPRPGQPFVYASEDTYVRTLYAAWLYGHGRPLPVVACGGPIRGTVAAEVMAQVLASHGVPAAAIHTERRSHNTHENASFAAAILRQMGARRILLVTEARHMPRAARCFRHEGLAVIPAPCHFDDFPTAASELFPNSGGIRGNSYTLHELVGLVYYRVRGWI